MQSVMIVDKFVEFRLKSVKFLQLKFVIVVLNFDGEIVNVEGSCDTTISNFSSGTMMNNGSLMINDCQPWFCVCNIIMLNGQQQN